MLELTSSLAATSGSRQPLPGGRRRAERGRQRPDPARDARSTSSTCSRPRATPAPRSAPPSTSGTRRSGGPRTFVMSHAYTGPAVRRGASSRSALAGSRRRGRAARRRRALPAGRRADRRRRRRRLVPGPDGVRPARARQPLDPRRPAARRDEGRPERAGQASRAVPPVRALDPRRANGRLVRPELPLAVHGARLRRAARASASSCRRSPTSTAPAGCRRSRRTRARATTG